MTLSVTKSLPLSEGEKAKAFKEDLKPLLENVTEVEVEVAAEFSAGNKYVTIENVVKLDSETPTNLEHVKGQVWLIDFWATWCPPCQAPMAHN